MIAQSQNCHFFVDDVTVLIKYVIIVTTNMDHECAEYQRSLGFIFP